LPFWHPASAPSRRPVRLVTPKRSAGRCSTSRPLHFHGPTSSSRSRSLPEQAA
jgi:hypothetical protein